MSKTPFSYVAVRGSFIAARPAPTIRSTREAFRTAFDHHDHHGRPKLAVDGFACHGTLPEVVPHRRGWAHRLERWIVRVGLRGVNRPQVLGGQSLKAAG
jgi:hypothetical protein